MKRILLFLAFAVFTANAEVETHVVYNDKHVVDTVYVKPPRDTVFIYDSTEVSFGNSEEQTFSYDRDSIAPTTNFYVGLATVMTPVSVWIGTVALDLDIEFENMRNGSVILNLSTLMEFYDFEPADDQTWEGYRSFWGLGLGYRYYLGALMTSHTNSGNKPVLHRNTPLNSLSPYLQMMAMPTAKIAYDGKYDADDKSFSIDVGGKAFATLGAVWNISNMLFNVGLSLGYQYWGDSARGILTFDRDVESGKALYALGSGAASKGMFFAVNFKIGL